MKQRQQTPGEDKKKKKKPTEYEDLKDEIQKTLEKSQELLKNKEVKDCGYCD